MAHKKAGGSTRNGRDSHSKRLGVKKFGGEDVLAGNILIRQRGTSVSRRRERRHGHRSHAVCHAHGIVEFRVKGAGTAHLRQRRPEVTRRAGVELAGRILERGAGRHLSPFLISRQTLYSHEIHRRSQAQSAGRQRRARLRELSAREIRAFRRPRRRRRRTWRQRIPARPSRA